MYNRRGLIRGVRMADFDFRRDTTDARLLMVAFTEGTPLEAREVASMLRALDGDYKDLTGRHLVLGRIETGSTYMWVYDALVAVGGVASSAAELARAIEDIKNFGIKMTSAFMPNKSLLPQTDMRAVTRTVKEVAKVAKKHRSVVEIRKAVVTDQGSETLDIKITPMQAISAKERLDALGVPNNGIKALPERSIRMLEEIRRLPPANSDTELVIATLVRALSYSGSTYALEQVADTLEAEGRSDLARIIRQHIGRGRGHVTVET